MDRRTFVKGAAGVAAASAVTLWSGKAPAIKKVYTMKFGTAAPDGTPWAEQLKAIKKEVESATSGSLKMELYLGTLGSETELVESLQLGTIEAAGVTIGALSAAVPDLSVLELPFLFNGYGEVDHILQKVLRKDVNALLRKKAFVLGGWSENGFRSFGTKSKVIRKPSDLKGLKMRSQPNEVHLAFWKALGANAQPINNAEALSALQTGIVDGFDNSPIYALVGQWWTAIKHWTTSEHIYQPALICWSAKFFNKLPKELQETLNGSMAGSVEADGLKGVRDFNAQVLTGFKQHGIAVVELTAAERKAFADKTRIVHTNFAKKHGDVLLNKINAGLKSFRKGA